MLPQRFLSAACLTALLVCSGCLPFSCTRRESRAITPADSVSRALAARITPDTLRRVGRVAGPAEAPMAYPRTLHFAPDGRLFVSDAEDNRLYVVAPGDTASTVWAWEGLTAPYLIGQRGDTLLVFNPATHRIDFAVDGKPVRAVSTPADLPENPFQYAAASDDALWMKVVADGAEGFILRLDAHGRPVARTPLHGPYWRYAGLLRTRGDTLLSLSGFRPVVDILAPGGRLDTLALVGFDSPMLARSYAFARGDTYETPLLTTAAAPVGDRLFVLNLRAGWLRVDVYDRTGRLQHVLVEPNPGYNKQFYPMDLAVREDAPGRYLLAVALVKPTPQVELYRWDLP